MKVRVALLTAGVVMCLAGPAGAVPVTFNVYDGSDIEIGVSFAYSSTDASNATITVWLDNLSTHTGTVITGFGFNVPDGTLDEVIPAQGPPFLVYTPDTPGDGSDFVGKIDYSNGGTTGIPADAHGRFDMAAFNGIGDDLNDGLVSQGIHDSGTFVFSVTGTGLDTLNEMSFLSLTSAPPNTGQGLSSFVVRWKDQSGGSGYAVPEPGALALLGVGLLSLLKRRQRC